MSNISSDEQALRNELAALYALHDTAVTDRDRYREALEPFARFQGGYDKGYALQAQRDEDVVFAFSDATITLGDLRRAAKALAAIIERAQQHRTAIAPFARLYEAARGLVGDDWVVGRVNDATGAVFEVTMGDLRELIEGAK
jgi:hypothetical protein